MQKVKSPLKSCLCVATRKSKFVPKNEEPEENIAVDEQINENRNRRK